MSDIWPAFFIGEGHEADQTWDIDAQQNRDGGLPLEAMSDDTRDKVISLEVKVEHLSKVIEDMDEKITELHEIMIAARGAKWAILGVAGMAGFLAAKLSPLVAWLGGAK